MKLFIRYTIYSACSVLILVLVGLVFTARHGPMGSGSIEYASQWRDILADCNSLDDVRKNFSCGTLVEIDGGAYTYVKDPNSLKKGKRRAILYEFSNGDWLAAAYADSHGAPGGGTIVTRDSNGLMRVFFGHVCGRPPIIGNSLDELYTYIEKHWQEQFINDI